MLHKNFWVMVGVALLSGAQMGCGEAPDEFEVTSSAITSENGLAANGLAANGLAANGLMLNGLAANGLAANGLAANGLAANGLAANGLAANGLAANGLAANGLAANGLMSDPSNQAFVQYLVSCALPVGRSVTMKVDGVSRTFPGALGLAPEWERGKCDGQCQRWVSACLLSRVNYLGVHREISMRGDTDALAMAPHELELYTKAEATYYGNLFQPVQTRYACLPTGATVITRVCGPSLATCPMTVVGECKDVCEDRGKYQSYSDCATSLSKKNSGKSGGERFEETVSVFLP